MLGCTGIGCPMPKLPLHTYFCVLAAVLLTSKACCCTRYPIKDCSTTYTNTCTYYTIHTCTHVYPGLVPTRPFLCVRERWGLGTRLGKSCIHVTGNRMWIVEWAYLLLGGVSESLCFFTRTSPQDRDGSEKRSHVMGGESLEDDIMGCKQQGLYHTPHTKRLQKNSFSSHKQVNT